MTEEPKHIADCLNQLVQILKELKEGLFKTEDNSKSHLALKLLKRLKYLAALQNPSVWYHSINLYIPNLYNCLRNTSANRVY
jgi:hypothetical protein